MPVAAMLEPGEQQAIERLIHRYAWLIDHGEAERVADLFTEDGGLFGIGPDKVGRPAVADWARQRAAMTERRSRHVHSNLLVAPVADGRASGTMIVTVYRHDGAGPASAVPLLVGDYADRYRKGPDGAWLIEERRFGLAFGAG